MIAQCCNYIIMFWVVFDITPLLSQLELRLCGGERCLKEEWTMGAHRKIFKPIKDGLVVHGKTLAKGHTDGLTTLGTYVGLGIIVGGISLTIGLAWTDSFCRPPS